MGTLNRDAILAAADLPTETVEVPEWGGTVEVRGLSASARDRYEASLVVERNGKLKPNVVDASARLAALTIIDDDGKRMFSDEDIKELGGKSGQALERVVLVAARLSGLGDDGISEAEADFEDAQP